MLEMVYRTLPVVLVFLTDALYAWVWGGIKVAPLLEWMPWVSLLALQVLFFYPQRHPWEDAVAARRRVWTGLAHDPLTWVSLALVALLLIPLFNKGLCPGCDHAAIRAGASPRPPMPYLPWCVNVGEHAKFLMLLLPSLIAALAVRHALVKRGKRMFLEMLAWNGALLAVYGFMQMGFDVKGPYGEPIKNTMYNVPVHTFSTFSYANIGGSYFVLMCAISIGIWRQRWNEAGEIAAATAKDPVKPKYLWLRGNYPLVAAVFNFFGALCSFSRAAIIMAFVLMLMSFIYVFAGIFSGRRKDRLRSVKNAAWAALGMMLFLAFVYVFAPDGFWRESDGISTTVVLDRVSTKGTYHARVGTAIFKAYPFFGVGFSGYKHHCRSFMRPDELRRIERVGGAHIHNDCLEFLCEFGVVGAGLLASVLVLLFMPIMRDWYQFYHVSKFTRPGDAQITTTAIYSLPPASFWTLVGTVMILVHSCGDCTFRSGAVLSALFTSIASMEGFIANSENGEGAVGGASALLGASIRHGGDSRRRHHHHHHHHHHHDDSH